MQSKVSEISNERDLARTELAEVNAKYSTTIQQNQKLMEQLRLFEQESFDI